MKKNEIENKINNNNSINESFNDKKLKEDLIKLRNIINNNKDEIRKLNEENTNLKIENEKLKRYPIVLEENEKLISIFNVIPFKCLKFIDCFSFT